MGTKVLDKQWYVISTFSQHERKAADNLTRRVKSYSLENMIFRILVNEKEVDVIKDGKPTGKKKMKNQNPGYIFVECIMTEDVWYIIRNTEEVTGIVGSSGSGKKPTPVPTEEMESILKSMGIVDSSMYDRYKVGDVVKVTDGSFQGLTGEIVSIDKESGFVSIKTIFFGRSQVLENIEFFNIEKL